MIVEQKVFNMYRHHDTSMLGVLQGPVPENQMEYLQNYLSGVFWFISNGNQEGNIVLPECDLSYLNSKILELNKHGLLEQKISIKNRTCLIKNFKRNKEDIFILYDFLTKIFENEIKRDVYYRWDLENLSLNKELHLKDLALNSFFECYVQGILSEEAIKANLNSLTIPEEHILKSSIDIFSDYKIWSLFLLTDKSTSLMPHIMKDFSKKLNIYNLKSIKYNLTEELDILVTPVYEMSIAKGLDSLINLNFHKFKKNSSMKYDDYSNSYVMETHSGETYI